MKKSLQGAAIGALALFVGAQPAAAQGGINDLVPRAESLDSNGVDMAGPTYRHREALLSINGGARPLDLNLDLASPGPVVPIDCFGEGYLGTAIYGGLSSNAYFGVSSPGTALHTAVLPHQSGKFWIVTSSGGQLPLIVTPVDDAYVTGAFDSNYSHFNYVGGDGTEATFSNLHIAREDLTGIQGMALDQVKFPDGETWTYRYNDVSANFSGCYGKFSRVRSIVSNRGHGLQFDYQGDATGTVTSRSNLQYYMTVARVTAYNKAVVHCDEVLLQSCASVTALNSAVTFSYGSTVIITKPNGETVELGFSQGLGLNLTSVTRPNGVTRTMTYEQWTEQDGPTYRYIGTLTETGRTWGYSLSPSYPGVYYTFRGEPGGAETRYDYSGGPLPNQIMDPLYRITGIAYFGWTRVGAYTFPEGNQVIAEYDARGNRRAVRQHPRPNSGLPVSEATAVYPSTCTASDRRSCNRPTSVTDFNGNTTDFTYDPAHGGVLTETGPAVPTLQNGGSIASVRPQKRYEYAQRYAWVSNGAGGYAQAAAPIWLKVRERACRTTAASGSGCAGGAADEVVTDYDYGPNSGPNNLLLRGQTVTSIDGGVTTVLRTCYGYDVNGNRISETQPNANLASCS